MALVYIRRLHVERDRRGRRGRDGEGEWCGVRVDRGELNGRVSCLGPRTSTDENDQRNGGIGTPIKITPRQERRKVQQRYICIFLTHYHPPNSVFPSLWFFPRTI